jgi:hypothetical protein
MASQEMVAALRLPDAQQKMARTGRLELMPLLGLGDRVPDLGAAVGALIDEVDLRQTPMGLDLSHIHRQ